MEHSTPKCDLCGLPLRYGVVTHGESEKTRRFCCTGCRQVFLMLSQSADGGDPEGFRETALFRKCMEMGLVPQNESELAGTWAPEPSPPAEPARKTGGPPDPSANLLRLRLKVDGMWCPVCAWAIEETLKKTNGVADPSCIFSNDTLLCDYNPVKTTPDKIIRTIEQLGYHARHQDDASEIKERRAEFIRLSVSAFLTMNIMMLSFALYFGFFRSFSSSEILYLSWPACIMAGVVFFYGGGRMHRGALGSLRTRMFGMETLISVGAVSAFGYSIFNLFSGSLHLYFDTTAMLVTLTLLGKWLERRARERVGRNLDVLFTLRPTKVRICRKDDPVGRYVSAEHLQPGDVFRVVSGEVIPADGQVVAGTGAVDESSITGEALPKNKAPGDPVMSGVRIHRGDLQVRADRVGTDGTLGQMLTLIEGTLAQKTPMENMAERQLRWFVPAIMGLAAATGCIAWTVGLSVDQSLIRAVTVLVVSCPCALGVAIPLARVAGIAMAGDRGILVRSFAAFDRARTVDAIVFDKTGTVTSGKWMLAKIMPMGPFSEFFLLGLAAGLESGNDHPIGIEILRQARRQGAAPLPVSRVVQHENGVSGWYDGKVVTIGAAGFHEKEMQTAGRGWQARMSTQDHDTSSRVYMGVDQRLAGILVFGDRVRANAKATLHGLQSLGYRLALVSGDGESATRRVARTLGVTHARGGQLPGDKVDFVKGWQAAGKTVAMVGDGVNDAPALARSDLGVAVYSGNPLGRETADITLMNGEVSRILDFFPLAALVRRKIAQNLMFTFLYNAIAIPVAMAGWLSPLVAVSAMLMSSLSVIGNTLLMIRSASRQLPANTFVDKPAAHEDHDDCADAVNKAAVG